MGKALFVGSLVLGASALLWSYLLLGIFTAFAAAGMHTTLLLPLLVGFGAGALSIAGGVLGLKRVQIGSALVLTAGVAGALAPVRPLLLNPQVEATAVEILVAYLAVGWWAVPMVLLGGIALVVARRAAGSPSQLT